MKRKIPAISISDKFFLHQTFLVVEGANLSPMRAGAIVKQVKAKGGHAESINSSKILNGNKLTPQERDKRLWSVTHVITGHHNAKDILTGLNININIPDEPPSESAPRSPSLPTFKIVNPEWVTECLVQKQMVDTAGFEVPMEGDASSPVGVEGGGKGPIKFIPDTTSAAKKRPREDDPFVDFPPECDACVRQAILNWGGPLSVDETKAFPKYACERPTPRFHPNPKIAEVFDELTSIYRAIGEKEREIAFGRSMAVIRAWPRRIRSSMELKGAPYCGQTTMSLVDEILETGRCERLMSLKNNKANMALLDLTRVHQVGHKTAQDWLNQGYETVDQILQEFEQAPEGDYKLTPFYRKCNPSFESLMGLIYFKEYDVKMDRAAVEEIAEMVGSAARTYLKNNGLGPETLLFEICGGYKRGKDLNGDADIVVSCTQAQGQRMREGIKNVLIDKMNVDMIILKEGRGVVQGYPHARPHEKLVGHDNMLTLLKYKGLYRRVDVICPPPDQWGPCVLGWQGSKQMEKDLREYAHEVRKTSFSQQAVFDDSTGKRVRNPKSEDGFFNREEDIWSYLGLKYLPPILRWA